MKLLEPEFVQFKNDAMRFSDLHLNAVLKPKSDEMIGHIGGVIRNMIAERNQPVSDVNNRHAEIHDALRTIALEEVHRRWMMFKAYTDEDFAVPEEIGGGG